MANQTAQTNETQALELQGVGSRDQALVEEVAEIIASAGEVGKLAALSSAVMVVELAYKRIGGCT